ncbi:transcription factor [archaeon]|nr:transcription factor [archaeon]
MASKIKASRLVEFGVTKDFLKGLGGESTVKLVKICAKKGQPVTDEEINQHLKLKITEVRAILNRLHFRGIASYDRTKNMKTGWYTYKWAISPKRIAELILENHSERLEKLETKKSFESNYVFFSCQKKCNMFPFEVAAEYEFRCPECGNSMNGIDGQKRANEIDSQITGINKEITSLQAFLNK